MSQFINLYHPMMEGTAPGLSASVIFKLCAFFVVSLLLLGAHALWETWSARSEIAHLQERKADETEKLQNLQQRAATWTQEDKALEAKVGVLTEQILAKQRLLNALSVIWGSTEGFSPYLIGLARQRMRDVWLRRIVITDGGRHLSLTGSTLSPEQVPELLQRLAAEEVFAGREFRTFKLSLADPASAVIDFELSTDEEKGS